ncbi:MAG: hypothetical protein R3E68_08395 [Burkholderiaceae bacterium]
MFRFARQSGGAIRVTSAQGQGSEFVLFVPAAEQQAPTPAANACRARAPLTGVHALLVDDEPELLQVYGAWLRTQGMVIDVEPSFDGALKRLRDPARPAIELMITDVFCATATVSTWSRRPSRRNHDCR